MTTQGFRNKNDTEVVHYGQIVSAYVCNRLVGSAAVIFMRSILPYALSLFIYLSGGHSLLAQFMLHMKAILLKPTDGQRRAVYPEPASGKE